MKKNRFILYAFFAASLVVSSCFPMATTTDTAKKPKTGSIYNPFIYRLHPEYFVFHQNNNTSRLYTKIYLQELMFAPIGPNRSYQGKIKIEYNVYKMDDLGNYIDSASTIYDIKKRKGQNNVITYLNIPENNLDEYYLHVKTTDVLRQSKVEDYIYVNKQDPNSSQNFIVNSKKNNHPYFKNYFRKDHVFSIQHNTSVENIFIRHYKEQAPLPPPPFSTMERDKINTSPDSTWVVRGNNKFQFSKTEPGFYYIQTDTTAKMGLGLLNSGKDFPYMKMSSDMVYPLAYLTKTAEFNELLESDNKKLAIDRFWLKCGGNLNRARELIRIYYNRTLYANIYFTSYTDGWRTDRGMIYIMFGPPKAVEKTPEKETWIYSDRLNYKVLKFVFNRKPNPYTNNDFVLERHLDFKNFWFKSIESWREGKVYTVFN